MPASTSEGKSRWRKRKREHPAARKPKLKEPEKDDAFEDNEDDEDPDLDPPQDHLETEDDPHNHNEDRIAQISRERESENLVDGGLKICDFPVAIKRVVNRPHSSVFGTVEAERAARNGKSRDQGHGGVAMLENISYGQLLARSAVPRDSPALTGAQLEDTSSGSGVGSYVVRPPKVIPGRGITKRLGSACRVHVVPAHADWFSPNSAHRLERQVVPHFFSGRSEKHTPERYMEGRNFIVAKYLENPEKHLSVADCQGLVTGFDFDDTNRVFRFLVHWGIINYCATPLKHEALKDGTYLCEESNGELRVPSDALKSLDSLIRFDKPKCRLKASDAYPELAHQCDEDADFESSIREQLSEHQCNYCSRSISTAYYQSQKVADVLLCMDCYNEGRFVVGHSSLDCMKVSFMKYFRDVDEDSCSDQETLLLLEGMQLYGENWSKIADHVGTKSKDQCLLHFVRLPLDSAPLDHIEVPTTSGSSSMWNSYDCGKSLPNSNGFNSRECDSESKFPFTNSRNPVMNLVAFLASALGPRVAAACAHASLLELSKDGSPHEEITNSSKKGPRSEHDAEAVPLSAERVRTAAKYGLAAAALKAKLFADHEEREIQRLSANIINHQLKRLELKLKQFAEVETTIMRECEQMERARQRISAERALMMSAEFGLDGPSRPHGLPGVGATNLNDNTSGNNRQPGSQQLFISGYSNNQPIHPRMSLGQQGTYGQGPRLPLSALHPSPSNSNAFNPASGSPTSLGRPMLRPVSRTKSGLG